MGLFRKKSAHVVRRGSATEERTVRTVGGEAVTVRRFSTAEAPTTREPAKQKRQSKKQQKPQQRPDPRRRRRPAHIEVAPPLDTARKQMLVRSMPHQTQIVVLEGPVLVEHYVARSDRRSLVGNVYLGKVRNVLPGMEAAFIDFGGGKNGVLYAGDVNYG
ncbi:MAG: ribonuclease E/G, partial [Acidimicrobiia bacterium]|nr:ribonuclease E/G [Acidimicrobiia bacterium]